MSRTKAAVLSAIALGLFIAGWIWAAAAFRFRVNPDEQLDRISNAHPGAHVPGVVRLDVRAFYESRDLAPAWVTERAPDSRAEDALGLLDAAAGHGLDPGDYAAAQLDRKSVV